ncbi:ABC transporter permease subunit [Paenibacillus sp. PDC88]|uniref:ABC transporter permease subunit n=1 Tax=Paenibacillus sp. PDC88 TaxID=1884375 RepID=UPI00089D870B|nr:ABC transporter permease subunit [Paenibacillus sp. PDC88]SDX48716.1 ABC-type dipeptide/oligopeptide/nickel transport system, permease component [Paenibacillus sp. PDC88]
MNLKYQMLKSLIVSILAFCLIVSVVLIPRQLELSIQDYKIVAEEPSLTLSQYTAHVSEFFKTAIENGSLGESRYSGHSSESEALKAMGRSLLVIVTALLIGLIFGILKGVMDYRLSKTRLNLLGNWTTWIINAIPDFFLILLIQWFIIKNVPFIRFFATDGWQGFIIPSLLVSIYPIVQIARLTSASLTSQENKLYIKLARAKGLREWVILCKHMLTNGIITILTHLPGMLVFILSNLLMVEIYRSYPGAAYRLSQALDYDTQVGTGNNYEPGVIIYIVLYFMLLFLLVQWIAAAARRYFDRQ